MNVRVFTFLVLAVGLAACAGTGDYRSKKTIRQGLDYGMYTDYETATQFPASPFARRRFYGGTAFRLVQHLRRRGHSGSQQKIPFGGLGHAKGNGLLPTRAGPSVQPGVAFVPPHRVYLFRFRRGVR